MTDARKALESAREALQYSIRILDGIVSLDDEDAAPDGGSIACQACIKIDQKALATIDAALASGEQPVAYIERSVLAHLAKDKHATATVCSGLLRAPFGDKVALFTMPTPPAPETRS